MWGDGIVYHGAHTILFQIVVTYLDAALRAFLSHARRPPGGSGAGFFLPPARRRARPPETARAAPVYPQAKYLSENGVKFDVIIGAKSKNLLILEDEFRKLNCNVYICTDDETYGFKGPVTNVLKMLCDGTLADANYVTSDGKTVKGKDACEDTSKKTYNHCVAIGSAVMMKFASLMTKELGIHTIVSMNMLMVDGTGMCGACRLMVDGQLKFCCIDGPEFDGHKIDYNEVMKRQMQYSTEEGKALLKYNEGETHHGGCGNCGG